MRKYTVKNITATLAAVEYPVADFPTPFTRGQSVILCVNKSADYNAGNLLIETDNEPDGTYSDVRASALQVTRTWKCTMLCWVTTFALPREPSSPAAVKSSC